MKTLALSVAFALLTTFAFAAPTEINYQGVLTDSQGNMVNGSHVMSLNVYDAASSGNLFYTENLGTVQVSKGLYQFTFGASGTSNFTTSESVASTDGTSTSYQKVLSASSVVTNSVSVTDGTYTWDQINGSSNSSAFNVFFVGSSRTVMVYYTSAPAAGTTINATYQTPVAGISGALSSTAQPWLDLVIDGNHQNPRQKILIVPYAFNALNIPQSNLKSATQTVTISASPYSPQAGNGIFPYPQSFFPASTNIASNINVTGLWLIPSNVKKISSINVSYKTFTDSYSNTGSVNVSIVNGNGTNVYTKQINTNTASLTAISLPVNLSIPFGSQYSLYFSCLACPFPNGSGYYAGSGGYIGSLSITADVAGGTAW